MRDRSGGIFTIDFVAGYGIFMVALAIVVYFTMDAVSCYFTGSYASELSPMAEEISNMLVLSPGSPPEWYSSPALARGSAFIGLSDGKPCVISSDKICSLSFFSDSELSVHLGLDDPERNYGVRIDVSSDDGTISRTSGYVLDDGTKDVCKCVRLVMIRDRDGNDKCGKLAVYLWRKYEGTAAADR